jgi:hypothetical protein
VKADKDAWFKPWVHWNWNGSYEGGLRPANWKGWLLTIVAVALGIGAYFSAKFFADHHEQGFCYAAWGAIPFIALLYMIIANETSNRP